jgi:hypothetical protein
MLFRVENLKSKKTHQSKTSIPTTMRFRGEGEDILTEQFKES